MTCDPTFVVYVDESGDEGFAFSRGSSDWFVVSAVITRKATDLETVKLVDRVRARLGKPPKKPLHFRDIKHEQRLPFVTEISAEQLRAVSVLVHKPSLKEPEKFQERHRLYHYTVRYLLERVSWYCRDHRSSKDSGDGTAEIVFSNRSGVSCDEMKNYLMVLEGMTGPFDVRVAGSVIKTNQISEFSSGRRMGLQIADAVASSAFYAVQPSRHGYVEDRYIRILKPVVYHHHRQYLGYGLKFWPREVSEIVTSDERLNWVLQDFK